MLPCVSFTTLPLAQKIKSYFISVQIDHPLQVHILCNTLIIYSLIRRPGPDTLADEAVGDEEDDERDEEVGKRKIEYVLRGAHPGRKF